MNDNSEIVIKPRRGWISLDLRDIWQYRELLYFLIWRDLKVKYKQSVIGGAWIILRPVINMLIFSVLFGRFAKFPSEGVPYPVFVLLGLLPWTYFSAAISSSTGGIIANGNLVRKIYFPRIIIPVSSNLANLFDFFVSLSILVVVMIYYKVSVAPAILLAPLLIVAFFISSLGPGMLFGALNVRYRDVGHTIPFIIQLWMYVSPVIYPVDFVPEKYRPLIYLNPVAGPIESFRACILGHRDINVQGLFISLAASMVIFFLGLFYFKKVERKFADIL